jgi:hypothetical protein
VFGSIIAYNGFVEPSDGSSKKSFDEPIRAATESFAALEMEFRRIAFDVYVHGRPKLCY